MKKKKLKSNFKKLSKVFEFDQIYARIKAIMIMCNFKICDKFDLTMLSEY